MARGSLLKKRHRRRELLIFLEMVGVMLQSGFELSYAWSRVLSDFEAELSGDLVKSLGLGKGTDFIAGLEMLSQSYPDEEHRLWFQVLLPLYQNGGPLLPTLRSIVTALREEEARDWQAHLRALPLKTSAILAVFFVAPALGLIFWGLVTQLTETFK